MADNGNENLRIKTVFGTAEDEDFVFSPEEMHPIEVAEALESDLIDGKTYRQVKRAQKLFRPNDIRSDFRISFKESLKNQFKGLWSIFLILSSLMMFLYRPQEIIYLITSIVVTAITFLNAFAEFRASRALRLPKKYSSLKAKVIRNGQEELIDSRQLVPGDIIMIESGMMVPADCRLIDDMGLSVLESHVSGNKGSSAKDGRYIAVNGAEAVSLNMIYAGSIVTSGSASAIVCRTGENTLIRRMKGNMDEYTPDIIKYVKNLCKFMSITSTAACFVLLFLGVMAGADITQWFVCAVAIGAASLCDSMVSLCISALGFGTKRMAQDGMVIKNYSCIQTLAAVNTIMCGKNLAFPPKRITLSNIYPSGKKYDREKRPDGQVEELLTLMLVCSEARKTTAAEKKQKRGLPEYLGGPIEEAVVEYFSEWNKPIGTIREQYIKMDAEYTVSGDISRMLALHNGKNTVIVRGSPENILSRCTGYTLDGTDYKLSDFTRKRILATVEDAAMSGSILIAIAIGETSAETLRDISAEDRLIFKGFISLSSSLDPGVASSVFRCENAGIETVLLSNDAYYSALNSAKSAGIINDESQIITAEQLRSYDRGLLIANSPYYRLFLNIDDSEWLEILRMRRDDKRITAVTAERINELPLMREADVSIVPETSCDTLRQTADAMLLGNGINLIADGILNAKTICRRISSVVKYLPCAMLTMLIASAFSIFYSNTPVLRTQDVLFSGIVFNLLFACALAFQPRHVKNLRDEFPFSGSNPVLNDFMHPLMFSVGAGIVLFICGTATGDYTCTMLTLTAMLFFYACSMGSHGGFFATKRFGNRALYLCGLIALAIIAALIFITPLGIKLGYALPTAAKLILSLSIGGSYCVATQILRYFMTKNDKKPQHSEEEYTEENDQEEKERKIYDYERSENDYDEDNG